MVDYLAEAFKALDDVEDVTPCLHEEMFTVDSAGLSELADFEVESEKSEDKKRVIDPEAKNEEELKSSYVGKVIIDCNQCHSKVYKDKEDIVIDGDDVNKEEECPYCFATEGFKVVGEVAPYTETKVDVEVKDEIKESIKGRGNKRGKRINEAFYRGNKDIKFVHHNEWEDSDLIYDGYTFNYWDIEDALWEDFLICIDEGDVDVSFDREFAENHPQDDVVEDAFDLYVQENGVNYLKDVIHGGYFEKGSKSWHDRISNEKSPVSELSYVNKFIPKPKIDGIQKKQRKGETIKDWYIKTYPTDELGEEIDEHVTFDEVLTGLKSHKDFYEMIGVYDSIVRERIFDEAMKMSDKARYHDNDEKKARRVDRKINSLKDYKFVEDLGDGVAKYQRWVDYDMKHYGKISDKTKSYLDRAGLEVVKDDHKDYEVIAKDEGLTESLEEVEVKTDTDKIKISSETITKDDEMAIPVTDDTREEIIADGEKEDTVDDIEEFDEESFDELSESYLKKVYNNVDGYKTSNVSFNKSGFCVEGIISFKSGNKKNTQFIFESRDNGKRFVGENKQITRGKKAFTVKGSVKDGKFITESFNYRYSAINPQTGKSENLYETLKRGK